MGQCQHHTKQNVNSPLHFSSQMPNLGSHSKQSIKMNLIPLIWQQTAVDWNQLQHTARQWQQSANLHRGFQKWMSTLWLIAGSRETVLAVRGQTSCSTVLFNQVKNTCLFCNFDFAACFLFPHVDALRDAFTGRQSISFFHATISVCAW